MFAMAYMGRKRIIPMFSLDAQSALLLATLHPLGRTVRLEERFKAAGRYERVLPGLGTHDAGTILRAVKALEGM